METSEAHRTRVRRKTADEEGLSLLSLPPCCPLRARFKLKETAEFLDRYSVGGKKKRKNYDAFYLFCKGLTRLHFMISGNCVRSSNNLVLSPSLSQTKVDGLINKNNQSLYRVFRISQSELTKSIHDSSFSDGVACFNS